MFSDSIQIPEPAILPNFVSRLFDKALENPSTETIRPIYSVISGLTFEILEVLQANLLTRLQDQLIAILRVLKLDDHSANILCLAIIAKLASMPQSQEQEFHGVNIVEKPVDKYHTSRQFFSSKRASKTIELTVLKAILVCSPNCALSPSQAVETLNLAKIVVDVVNIEDKKLWASKNNAKLKKLFEKISRQDLQSHLRYAVRDPQQSGQQKW